MTYQLKFSLAFDRSLPNMKEIIERRWHLLQINLNLKAYFNNDKILV